VIIASARHLYLTVLDIITSYYSPIPPRKTTMTSLHSLMTSPRRCPAADNQSASIAAYTWMMQTLINVN